MLKTHKNWIALLVAVVMVAGWLVPFVGTANAMVTYGATNFGTVSAGLNYGLQYAEEGTWTFDVATYDSVYSQPSDVFADLPSSPAGYAWGVLDYPNYDWGFATQPADGTQVAQRNPTNPIWAPYFVGAQYGIVKAWGSNWVQEPDNRWFPRTVKYELSNCVAAANATNVTIILGIYLFVPSGVSGYVNETVTAPSNSVFTSVTAPIATIGAPTATVAVESTPALSTAGGAVGVIDVTESAAGALASTNDQAGLKFTLPPGFSWGSPSVIAISSNMWGTPIAHDRL